MTIKELKETTMKLLEEYSEKDFTDDEDLRNKLDIAINATVGEVSRFVAIIKTFSFTQQEYSVVDLPSDYYKVKEVLVDGEQCYRYSVFGGKICVSEIGEVEVKYDALPKIGTDDNQMIPFDERTCNIIPFGVAKILLMGTGELNTAEEFEKKYYNFLQSVEVTTNKCKAKIKNIFGGK